MGIPIGNMTAWAVLMLFKNWGIFKFVETEKCTGNIGLNLSTKIHHFPALVELKYYLLVYIYSLNVLIQLL